MTLSKALDISTKKKKKNDKIKELGMYQRLYKYYGQWTAVDLHKNH